MTDWIPHDGGPRPVREGETLVAVRFRDKTEHSDGDGWGYSWGEESGGTITHYRVTPPRVATPPMSEDEIMVRAREAAIAADRAIFTKQAQWSDQMVAQVRDKEYDGFTAVISAAKALRDYHKPLAEVAPHTVAVDPVMQAAREIAAGYMRGAGWPRTTVTDTLGGKNDDLREVLMAAAAIRRGMEMGRGE